MSNQSNSALKKILHAFMLGTVLRHQYDVVSFDTSHHIKFKQIELRRTAVFVNLKQETNASLQAQAVSLTKGSNLWILVKRDSGE